MLNLTLLILFLEFIAKDEKILVLPNVTVSIVSHGNDDLVKNLLSQLAQYNTYISKVILTHNTPSNVDAYLAIQYQFEILNIRNNVPLGYGENHNRAFKFCETEYYCVMNPDIILNDEPFGALLECSNVNNIGITGPLIKNIEGDVEDSARYFPTLFGLVKKFFGLYDGVFPIQKNECVIYPEWIGGMFMLIKNDLYYRLSGFDETYFLYYEDVDLCLRAWRSGNKVALCKGSVVVHDARRASHRKLKYMKWHVTSIFKFQMKHLGRFPKVKI